MSPSYLVPLLPHQEGMVARPEFGCPTERRDDAPHDHAGRRPILPRNLCWFGEVNPGLFDRQTNDIPPGDI